MIALILFQLLYPFVLFLHPLFCDRINTIPTITSIRIIFTVFFDRIQPNHGSQYIFPWIHHYNES